MRDEDSVAEHQGSAVVTVTIDPSLDTTVRVCKVEPNVKLRAKQARHDPGGGGINVARAMKSFDTESTALWTKGGSIGDYVATLLDEQKVSHIPIEIGGNTKQSFAVIEEITGDQYRFSEQGPRLTEPEEDAIFGQAERLQPEFLVLSGGLPPGVSPGLHARLATTGSARGAYVIVDSHGDPLRLAVESGKVGLIKPNLHELGQLTGRGLQPDVDDAARAARDVISDTQLDAVVVSLGEAGAVLVTIGTMEHIPAPPVDVDSRIGAGDSMVAGIVASLVRGSSLLDAARLGVAAGTAAVMTPATQLCRREDIEEVRERMAAA